MNIKDYLHLYLGCDVQYPDTDGKLMVAKFTGFSRADGIETTYKKKPKKGEAVGDYLSWKDNGYHKSNALNIKLILRPLSDMTEDEVKQLDVRGSMGWKLINPEGRINQDVHLGVVHRQSFEVRFLLSRGFDIFGLIDAGLAIDKTKL